jgi:uncharacterized protein YkwD
MRDHGLRFLLALSLAPLALACSSSPTAKDELGGGGASAGASAITPFDKPADEHSHGDPTPREQELLELVQRARANPPEEGKLIVALDEVQGAMKQFKVDAQEIIDAFAKIAPAPPLTFEAHLMASARVHSEDMAKNGFQEHEGTDGKDPFQRMSDAGYKYSFASENIFAHAESMSYCHAAFLIDWGNPEPGHREALLDMKHRQRDIGISVIEDPPNSKVGPFVVTEDFGMPLGDKARFVVGVAYTDDNGNGAYDAGEGHAGLTVVPEKGSAYAVTSTSGGYAVPLPQKTGAVKVQLWDAGGTVLLEREVDLQTENVKLDFVLTKGG